MLNFQSSSLAAFSAAMLAATTVGVADTLSRLRGLVKLGGHNVDRLGYSTNCYHYVGQWSLHYIAVLSQWLPLTPSPSVSHQEVNNTGTEGAGWLLN